MHELIYDRQSIGFSQRYVEDLSIDLSSFVDAISRARLQILSCFAIAGLILTGCDDDEVIRRAEATANAPTAVYATPLPEPTVIIPPNWDVQADNGDGSMFPQDPIH